MVKRVSNFCFFLALTVGIISGHQFALTKSPKLFIDFSEKNEIPQLKMSESEKKKLYKKIFPNYILDRDQCQEGSTLIEDSHIIDGHFSNAKKKQILVGLQINPCPASHAGEGFMVALLEDEQIVSQSKTAGYRFVKTFAATAVGTLDVIVEGSHLGQGHLSVFGQTLTFKDGKISESQIIKNMIFAKDNCGYDEDSGSREATVFFVETENPLKLSIKTYTQKCSSPKNKDFKFLSNKPLEGY